MIFFPEIDLMMKSKWKKTKMTEMLKLSEEVHKAIIRKSIWNIDEEKVEEIASKRPDANPFRYLYFREKAWSVGYDDWEINEKYKKIADKILASSCPILTCLRS